MLPDETSLRVAFLLRCGPNPCRNCRRPSAPRKKRRRRTALLFVSVGLPSHFHLVQKDTSGSGAPVEASTLVCLGDAPVSKGTERPVGHNARPRVSLQPCSGDGHGAGRLMVSRRCCRSRKGDGSKNCSQAHVKLEQPRTPLPGLLAPSSSDDLKPSSTLYHTGTVTLFRTQRVGRSSCSKRPCYLTAGWKPPTASEADCCMPEACRSGWSRKRAATKSTNARTFAAMCLLAG